MAATNGENTASVEIDKELMADIQLLAMRNRRDVPEVIRAAVRAFIILLFKGDETQFDAFKRQHQITAEQSEPEPEKEKAVA